ncbi:MAG: molybdate ABC transporter substrate-binding protein [Firmicutes bacterium]|nr:molybdate ABC transporter substrate-binding protein [Bacillota bacterium]
MKKFIALMVSACLVFSMAACSSTEKSETADKKTEVIVFGASSMTETLTEIGNMYMAENENISLIFNFDSSGTLKTQIEEGADCDIFISAGQKQMNQLDKNADPSGLDLVYEGTRIDLLENRVTLCKAENSDTTVDSFDTLAKMLADGTVMLAMGNSDVPVGQYTQKILAYYGLNEEELANSGVITYGSNVKEVTTQVSEGTVDCGIIYCTDAFSAGLDPIDYATAEMCGQVIYPAALINTTKVPEEAKAFLDYLTTDTAMAVFEKVGFAPAF